MLSLEEIFKAKQNLSILYAQSKENSDTKEFLSSVCGKILNVFGGYQLFDMYITNSRKNISFDLIVIDSDLDLKVCKQLLNENQKL